MRTADKNAIAAIEQILRLRRIERGSDSQTRADLAVVREYLEAQVGPTVKPAIAARLFGVSQPALNRWLSKNEIASVITPAGRREVPLNELLPLLEDAEQLHLQGSARPLAAVLKRRDDAAGDVDINRLLPPNRARGHRAAELQSLAYHRLVAERLDDQMAEQARRRLAQWRTSGRIHPRWAEEWERILALPLPRLRRAIAADTPRARELRQTSPFAGAISDHERRRLARAVEQRVRG